MTGIQIAFYIVWGTVFVTMMTLAYIVKKQDNERRRREESQN